jgi:hypothetical protein
MYREPFWCWAEAVVVNDSKKPKAQDVFPGAIVALHACFAPASEGSDVFSSTTFAQRNLFPEKPKPNWEIRVEGETPIPAQSLS